MKFQPVLLRQFTYEFGVRIAFAATNLVIEMNSRDNDPQVLA